MGDRAVIGFKADKEAIPVFLYMHWGGSDRYKDAQRAIEGARSRWDDSAYATRIGISQIVANDWSEEVGFGISAGYGSYCEPDYGDVIIINWGDKVVNVVPGHNPTDESQSPAIDFETFLLLTS
jgi:hypothetical protein